MFYYLKIDHWPIFKKEKNKKAAKSEVPGVLLFENRSLVDFQIGNEQKGCQIGGSK